MRLWHAGIGVSVLVSLGTVTFLSIWPVNSTRELGKVLGEQRSASEPLVMLNNYYFDVPFYARLASPVQVVDDWSSPEVQQKDNWRKELADANRFDAVATPPLLLEPSALAASLCRSPVSWVMGAANAPERYVFLRDAQAVASFRRTTLWRVAPNVGGMSNALGCPGTTP